MGVFFNNRKFDFDPRKFCKSDQKHQRYGENLDNNKIAKTC